MNNDKVHDNKFVIESVDSCGRIYYDGFLSDDDVSILQSNVSDINYSIKNETHIVMMLIRLISFK